MKRLAAREQTMFDAVTERDSMVLGPGVLLQKDIERLADRFVAEVYMLVRFGPADSSRLSTEKYQDYRTRYEGSR